MLDVSSSHSAVRQSAGVFFRGDTISCVRGTQRLEYVSHLLSKSVEFSGIDTCVDSLLLNNDGIILGLAVAILREDRIYLVTEAEQAWHDLAADAQDDFDITVESLPHRAVQVEGPLAWAVVQTLMGDHNIQDVLLNECIDATMDDEPVCLARVGTTAEYGYLVFSDTIDVLPTLAKRAKAEGGGEVDPDVVDRLRLEASFPVLPSQGADCTVFEAGLGWLVTLTDEAHYVGRAALSDEAPTRRTVVARFPGCDCPPVGTPVLADGAEVGHVLVSTHRAGQDDGLALLLMDDPFGVPGLEFEIGGITAETISRPTLTPESWIQQIGVRQ
ncbi:MAG: hypothetical protein FWF43_02240 [Propionibacteriaceae bacterium]|nr:hypothetical protein [Propionibacteriaceae bacterium]